MLYKKMKGKSIMALLFSEVTLTAEDMQRKFLVSGIPMDLDDLDGWTAYEDFLLALEDEISVKFICDSYLYGERTIEEATPEEVAYLTMRSSSDPEFLNRHCKKIHHSEDDVSLDPIIFHL